jgi:branched-chain amino acid transport system permease protein
MNVDIALLLGQDGITNGAIYGLLAVALVLIYAVTRIIFIPQGQFVAYGALTLAEIQYGRTPSTVWLVVFLGFCAAAARLWRGRGHLAYGLVVRTIAVYVLAPLLLAGLVALALAIKLPISCQIVLAVAIVTMWGPILYQLVFLPVAATSVLHLLIVSVALDFALSGLGLLMFGAEGVRTEAVTSKAFEIGVLNISGQSLWVIGASIVAMGAMYLFFGYTMYGTALRATAANRAGARLMGIRPELSGAVVMTLAAALGGICGVLISPLTTSYFDSGFLIGLKGFVAAIIGGLVSYPVAALGALFIGLLESFSSFWASGFKEVIVFTLIVPVLLWRSLRTLVIEGDDE